MDGIGVNIAKIFGKVSDAPAAHAGKKIKSVALTDDRVAVSFESGGSLIFYDDGQSCCESRYIRTDDNLEDFAGAEFRGAEIRSADDMPDEWGTHEVQFLVLLTDKGNITFSAHNEHNGYYGGFAITVEEKP